MKKFFATLFTFLLSPAWGAVTFVNNAVNSGVSPMTTSSYTPTAGNQVLLFQAVNSTALTFSLTGSASTPTVIPVSSANNFNDGIGAAYSLWGNLSVASGAQTWTITAGTNNITEELTMEFAGGVSVQNSLYQLQVSPGTGTGAISAQAVTVASTDILVVILIDATGGSTSTINLPSGSSAFPGFGNFQGFYWSGTGGSMTPTFTAGVGHGTDTFMVVQFVMSASGGAAVPGILMSNGHPVLSNSNPVLSN